MAGKKSKKTPCLVTRGQYKVGAKPLTLTITGPDGPVGSFTMYPKADLDSGSLGYFLSDKATVGIGGIPVKHQIGFNLTAVNSKELPADDKAAA